MKEKNVENKSNPAYGPDPYDIFACKNYEPITWSTIFITSKGEIYSFTSFPPAASPTWGWKYSIYSDPVPAENQHYSSGGGILLRSWT
ncbi:hypothetical protein EVAR_103357_1 [Eumeta japonica]|uniref:Uncharacterized protein n=1 Tax=Eumeta variegata TaxID=151549 RepID=A0A4C1Y9D0_EUMVA|nr:hypothetical protein EVAR_103357_1 [Eumeta japonica]